jgi:UDP-N-acetylglucosamine diphosphorylase / glucose-1-phosphate thymidylyltransferase / UDP-N-acetylgalactosamine diphosphorylase / glucosamine-1-phosphate N-acetyltransferase / galactosamine-1-phosphate N-acetyltransferase
MQAVILAAGRGSRLAPLTDTVPKPLLKISGKSAILHLLEALPEKITDIIIVTKYLENVIKETIGDVHNGRKITYVTQGDMSGTYAALLAARPYITTGSFLVMSADDILGKQYLEEMVKYPLSFGVHKKFLPGKEWLIIESDSEMNVRSMRKPTDEEFKHMQFMATGTYVLDGSFWEYDPILLVTGEYGLPQTMRPMLLSKNVHMVEIEDYLQINTHEEFAYANQYFGKKHI